MLGQRVLAGNQAEPTPAGLELAWRMVFRGSPPRALPLSTFGGSDKLVAMAPGVTQCVAWQGGASRHAEQAMELPGPRDGARGTCLAGCGARMSRHWLCAVSGCV